ncbi:DUF2567 domain-containing protein [Nocardia takedensis]|uniref:DUF2567 domain-containing protein n=1 Tax=Nocardia takedensis TaxID=259390 RepID=UPI0002FF0B41
MRAVREGGVRGELWGCALIVLVTTAVSILAGVAWGLLAPGQQALVVQSGRQVLLPGESVHDFDALAIFACTGGMLGALTAVGAWRLRSVRGPLVQIGVLVAAFAGAFGMRAFGELVAQLRYPVVENAAAGQIVDRAPELGSALALLAQPLVASLVMLFLAALSPREDLGTGYIGPIGATRPVPPYGPNGSVDGGLIPYGTPGPYGQSGSIPSHSSY